MHPEMAEHFVCSIIDRSNCPNSQNIIVVTIGVAISYGYRFQ